MQDVTRISEDSRRWRLEATCEHCGHTFQFNFSRQTKRGKGRCAECGKSFTFRKPDNAPIPPKSEKTHEEVDKSQADGIAGIVAALDEAAAGVTGGLDEAAKAELTAAIADFCPQGDLFSFAIELYLEGALPPDRVTFYSAKLGKGLDLMAKKYGYENVLMEYSLEATLAYFAWQCSREMEKYEAVNKKKKDIEKGRKIPVIPGGLEGEIDSDLRAEQEVRLRRQKTFAPAH